MQQITKDVQRLDKKIQEMKQKGFCRSKNKHAKFFQTSIAMQIVIELVSGVVVGAGIGYILNEIFDFGLFFLISLIILGGIAGCLNVSRYIKQQEKEKDKDVDNG